MTRIVRVETEDGPITAGLVGARDLVVLSTRVRQALIGESKKEEARRQLALPIESDGTALAMDGRGDDVFVGTSAGELVRIRLADTEPLRVAEVVHAAGPITALRLLNGDRTLVVGDANGGVSSWQIVAREGSPAELTRRGGARGLRRQRLPRARAPLTAVRGYAETLLGGAIDDREKALQFLQVIERHSERLARLIDDLLTLSDLELGRAEIRPRALAVRELVESVLEVLRQKAEAKTIELQSEVPADLPELLGDRDRIEEVLINLVDNAIKYSGPGTHVRVRARNVRSEGAERVEIAVEDEGLGIPEHDLPRLTERFYRVDRARSRELGGTGLGLAIVKHIVQAHGGSIAIESRVGVGTTFRVTLPAAATG